MSFKRKRLAAVFFLRSEAQPRPIEELLVVAGATGLQAPPEGVVFCRWAGMSCEVRLLPGVIYRVLVISFWQSDFLTLLASGDENATDLLADTFRRACEALHPMVAFVATHLDQATDAWILGREWDVLNCQANRLAVLGLGLLYFGEETDECWVPHPGSPDRDELPVDRGRLLFAGRGTSRWF